MSSRFSVSRFMIYVQSGAAAAKYNCSGADEGHFLQKYDIKQEMKQTL